MQSYPTNQKQQQKMFSFEIKASEDFDKEIDHSIVASLLYGSVFIHKTFNVEMNQMGGHSCSEGHEFESQWMDIYSHLFVV